MKILFPTLLILLSFNTYAFPVSELLYCSEPNRFSLYVNVTATDQEHYQIKLMDQNGNPMPVYQSNLTFNELGEIQSITASATVELLYLKKINETWEGMYWYDFVSYQLTCQSVVTPELP
jgi:hypothetical protein